MPRLLTSLLLLIGLCLLATPAAAREDLHEEFARADFDLQGPVKVLKEIEETVGSRPSVSNEAVMYYFDESGTLTKAETYKRQYLDEVRTYAWGKGEVTLITERNIAVDPSRCELEPWRREECTLDGAGRIRAVDFFQRGTLAGTLTREYDHRGRLITERTLSPDGETLFLQLSNFDDVEGSASSHYYGLRTRPVTDLTEADERHDVEYDAEGRVVRETIERWNKEGVVTTVDYTYDAAGRLILEEIHASTGAKETTTSTYDEHGNLTRRFYETSRNTTRTDSYKYKYDEHGNWVWRLHHEETMAIGEELPDRMEVTRRSITYY